MFDRLLVNFLARIICTVETRRVNIPRFIRKYTNLFHIQYKFLTTEHVTTMSPQQLEKDTSYKGKDIVPEGF